MNDSILLLDIGASAGELPTTTPAPVRYGTWFPAPHEAAPVPTVSGLTATPVADGILLEWDAVDLPDVVYVIERATAQTGPWIELARTANTHYLVSDPSGDTWFFRVIALVRGRAGGETWVEGASKVIAGDEDIAELIEKQKEIDEARVLEKVEQIDINAETLLEELLRSHEFNDIRRQHGDTISRAVADIALLVEDGKITAQQVVDLFAQLDDETSIRQAQYLQTNQAIVDETSARVSAITSLHAQVTTEMGAASAALNERIDTAEATAESARASTEQALVAQIIAGDSAVSTALEQQINTVETTAESARASMATALGAQIAAGDSAVSTALHQRANEVETSAASARASMQSTWTAQLNNTQALLQSSINTKVTAWEAQAIAQTQVQAFQNGTYASLQQSFNVVASEHNSMYGKWGASYSVKLTGGTFNGQPIIAGISLSSNPNTGSDFIVQADNFYLINQNASHGLELRDGYLRVFRGNVQRIIGNGFGAGSQLVDYFGPNVGPGSASKTNAVMWMDTSGNAGFNGTVSAGKIVGGLQHYVAVNWTGNVDLIQSKPANAPWVPYANWRTVTTFALPAPPAGEQHIPLINLMIGLSDRAGELSVQIEHLSNGTWQPYWQRLGQVSAVYVSNNSISIGAVYEQSVSLQIAFPRVGHEKQFRISVRCRRAAISLSGNNTPIYHHTAVTSVTGTVIGLR